MYTLFPFPDSTVLNQATRTEARRLFNCFVSHIPERLKVLEEYVQTRNCYEKWCLSYEDSAALELQKWFETEISTRPKTEAEIQDYYNSIPERFKGLALPQIKSHY